MPQINICWICRGQADSTEHMFKRASLKAAYAGINQTSPLFAHNAKSLNVPFGSIDSKRVRFDTKICALCNNERTQDADLAWDELCEKINIRAKQGHLGRTMSVSKAFGSGSRQKMKNVHLYFAKHCGMVLAEADDELTTSDLSESIMNNRVSRNLFLLFGLSKEKRFVLSNLEVLKKQDGNRVLANYATQLEYVDVEVIYFFDREEFRTPSFAWHPTLGRRKIHFQILDLDRQATSAPHSP